MPYLKKSSHVFEVAEGVVTAVTVHQQAQEGLVQRDDRGLARIEAAELRAIRASGLLPASGRGSRGWRRVRCRARPAGSCPASAS